MHVTIKLQNHVNMLDKNYKNNSVFYYINS